MRYIKQDFPKVVQLKNKAQAAEEKLRYIVLNIDPDTEREYRREVITATKNAVSSINKALKSFCKEELPSGFREGQKASDGGKEELSLSRQQAAAILKDQGFRYSEKAYRYDRYVEIHTAAKKAGESFISRVTERLDKLSKDGDDSVYAAKQAIEKELEESGLLTVEYANGARQPISAYATMAARSARIESQNIGGIGRALEHGTDIVKCVGMYPTCQTCRKFIGKWFSISGNDKRFPALFGSSGPLKRKYATIHPNCRCEFLPVYLDFETDEEIKKKAAESKAGKKQSKTEAELYAAWQGQHRREREEETLFRNLKTVYGEDMPYKTLAGFRRAYRGNPDIIDKNQSILSKYIDKTIKYGRISGAKRFFGDDEQLHGEIRYPAIRKDKYDVEKIAKNTGYTVDEIQEVKNYLFIDEHDLGGTIKRFDPDDDIAKSWDRLRAGKDIREIDFLLINHEVLERKLVKEGLTQDEAHIRASEKHNYQEAVNNVKNKKSKRDQ